MRNWSICLVPVGPESRFSPEEVFSGTKEETLKEYQRLREEGGPEEDSHGIVVRDQFGQVIYACS